VAPTDRFAAPLEKRSQERVRGMLTALDEERRHVLLEAMDMIQNALGEKARLDQQLTLRAHRPGDMGWVVQRHGEIYHQEYGWNEEFEALVAEITAEFVRKLDVTRERCWIAEHDGRRVGCIFLVAKDTATAKLRLLLVDPDARGLGVGRKLVAECVRFARAAGYRKIVLWTQETLTAARHLYSEAGFVKTAREPHRSFGHDLVGETWERELHGAKT
jgi:GNAT superfamily N-acetyltransferase